MYRIVFGHIGMLISVLFVCMTCTATTAQDTLKENTIKKKIKPQSKDSIRQDTIAKVRFGEKLKQLPHQFSNFFNDEKPKPKKALWMTFILPGSGQAYNNKHWKIPIVYAGIGGLGYAIAFNTRNYKRFKTAYIYRLDGDENTIEEEFTQDLTDASLQNVRDGYRNDLERSYLGLLGFYALVSIDAFVDAHLQGFNIDDDLSWELKPSLESQQYSSMPSMGMNLTLTFGKSPIKTLETHPIFEEITQKHFTSSSILVQPYPSSK